jgi:hypothetical protein
MWGDIRPTSNSEAGGPPIFGCPRLLIQYNFSYHPYLEAISSSRSLRTQRVDKGPTWHGLSRCTFSTFKMYSFEPISLFWKERVGLWDHVALCVSVYPPIVARQRFGKNSLIVARQRIGRNVTAITNTHPTKEELLDASFSMWPVSHQGKQANSYFSNFLLYLHFLYLKVYKIYKHSVVSKLPATKWPYSLQGTQHIWS